MPKRVNNFTIIVINLVPLLGVLFLGWSGGLIATIYAIETIFVGVLNVVKMMIVRGERIQKMFLIPFFIVHYGLFVLVQGVFIIGISFSLDGDKLKQPYFLYFFGISLLSMLIGQLLAFWRDFLQPTLSAPKINPSKDYGIKMPENTLFGLMFQPYARVFVQQFVVILGMFMMLVLKWHYSFAILLIALKTMQELAHNQTKVEKSAY